MTETFSRSRYFAPTRNSPHNSRNEHTARALYEKAQLLKIVETAWHARTDAAWKPHPLFGKMTPREWGKLLQMHLDYHLRQFAA